MQINRKYASVKQIFIVPLFHQDDIDENTRLAVWKIEEPEDFFLSSVSVQREITHPQKRLQHLAARYLLTQLYPDFPHHQISVASSKKPFLPSSSNAFLNSGVCVYSSVVTSEDR